MLGKETVRARLGNPIAYYSTLARIPGGVEDSLFVSQFFYWYDKGHNPEAWIYKTQDEISEETGLTRRNQETARKQLRKIGVLEEKRIGIPERLTYRLNLDVLAALVHKTRDGGASIRYRGIRYREWVSGRQDCIRGCIRAERHQTEADWLASERQHWGNCGGVQGAADAVRVQLHRRVTRRLGADGRGDFP